MKNNKNGITLIALVITIIVLLILAGISISLVTGQNGVLTRAEDASNTYSMSSAKEQANMRAAGYVSEYTEKVYVDNDLGIGAMTAGEYVLSQINGEEDGDYSYSVSGSTITVTSKKTGEALASGTIGDDGGISWSDNVASGGNNNTQETYTEYTMGQTVTLGGEDFWVIEDSNANTSTVKLLAKLNVITTEGDANRYKQDPSANTLAFDSTSHPAPYTNIYENSTIKTEVDNYKTAVEGRMGPGKTIQEARLMTGTKLDSLQTGELGALLDANKTEIAYGPEDARLKYWLITPYEGTNLSGWYVLGNYTNAYYGGVISKTTCGLRPVFIVLKSNI